MKYSVLMSIYVKEKPDNFKLSMNSMLNQTIKPSEIVLVCDGKLTKQLDDVIFEFENILKSDDNIKFKVVRIKENVKLGNALNIGLKNCENELVCRMDTDDISLPTRVEEQLKLFSENPELVLVGTNLIEFENVEQLNDLKSLNLKNVPESDKEIRRFIKYRCPFNHMSVMFKKSKVIEEGSYEEILYNEDYYLWMKLVNNNKGDNKFYNIQKPLVYMRVNNETYKRRGGIEYIKPEIKAHYLFWKKHYINFFEFLRNVVIRTTVRLMPNSLRGFVYKKLRTKNNK